MCIVCAMFNPYLDDCEYDGLPTGTTSTGASSAAAQGATTNEVGDAAGDITTTASIAVDGYFMGELQTANDVDWIAVELVAGQQYTIAIVGTGALGESNDDPYLRLRDASGNLITEDDDGGPGRYSDLTFTAATTGTYYVDAQSWANSDAGTYGVSVTTGDRASFNAEMGAGTLLRPDAAWTSTPGTGATVTWSIRDSGTEPVGGNTFIAPSAAQVVAITDAMDYIDGLSGLDFNQVNEGGTSNNATMVFGAYSASDGRGAYAYYPTNASVGSNAGDVWLNNTSVSTSSLPIGSYSYFVMLHEIGHAIGLAHPGDYNATQGGGPITYQNSAQFIEDSHQYTVMSYFGETSTGASSLGYPDTFMLYDILAIHELYGADTGFHSEDTTYGFNATHANSAYDFTFNTTPLMSVYDGAGTDTIDLSGYTSAQNLTLVEGVFSDIGGYVGNFSIAYGAVIENAIGGSGDDTITGNAAANVISGGDGKDSITGGDGEDTISGGDGGDTLSGGNDADTISGEDGEDSISGDGGDDRLHGQNDADTLKGGSGNDTLEGGKAQDELHGGDNDDVLWGQNGGDSLFGGTGIDMLYGGFGRDTLEGGDDGDRLAGQDGNDRLSGNRGDDSIYGGNNDDWLWGENGNDILEGETGEDTLYGGAGRDTLRGGNDDDALMGEDGQDRLHGNKGDDTVAGGNNNDWLWGQDGMDDLDGGAGDDVLDGGTGSDTLNGGAGDDVMTGGKMADQFVYAEGADTITDFSVLEDTLVLEDGLWGGGLTAEQVVTTYGGTVDTDYVLDFGNGNTLTFTGGLSPDELSTLISFI